MANNEHRERNMIVLHDGANTDLSHIQAIAAIEEGFGLFDYVKISQRDNMAWIGQIIQPTAISQR